MDTTRRGSLLGTPVTTLVLLVGPLLTLLLVKTTGAMWMRTDMVSVLLVATLVMWSPVFFSIPAFLTQDGRDAALPQLDGVLGSLVRGVVLVPYLVFSPNSTVRIETAASLIGVLAASLLVV